METEPVRLGILHTSAADARGNDTGWLKLNPGLARASRPFRSRFFRSVARSSGKTIQHAAFFALLAGPVESGQQDRGHAHRNACEDPLRCSSCHLLQSPEKLEYA